MIMKISTIVSAILVAASLMLSCGSCSDEKQENNKPRTDIQLTQSQQEIAQNANKFAIDLFKATNDTAGNVAVSPYSIETSLAMLANGASGTTLSEILNVLHAEDSGVDGLNTFYQKVTTGLYDADNRVNLSIANALWAAKYIKMQDEYAAQMKNIFNAEVSSIDFTSSNALKTINAWVGKATGGKIGNLFEHLSPMTIMCVANVLSFEGKWTKEFEVKNTQQKTFKNWKGENETIKQMIRDGAFSVAQISDADVVELTYGNGAYVMDVIVPTNGSKINEWISQLTYAKYNEMVSKLGSEQGVKLFLPKFVAKSKSDLIPILKQLGLNHLFNKTDLSGITETPMSITQYVHQMNVTVDESGTKVESATGAVGGYTSFLSDSKEFIVDSPFIYMVRERSTGAILLIGKVQTMAGMQ